MKTYHSFSSGSTSVNFDLTSSNSEVKTLLEQGRNDVDNDNWVWPDKAQWKVVTGWPQRFNQHWRDNSGDPKFHHNFPYLLPLAIDADEGHPSLFFLPIDTRKQIVVTKSYEATFQHLMFLRVRDFGSHKGAVVTGQPGIGKTTFLMYMLVRLISAHQNVLLCSSDIVWFFYGDEVYIRQPIGLSFHHLPQRKKGVYFPTLALIDLDSQKIPPTISTIFNMWPIQASSPRPERYESWSKQAKAALVGLPRWETPELKKGLPLLPWYDDLRGRLQRVLTNPADQSMLGNQDVMDVLETDAREKAAETDEVTEVQITNVDDAFDVLLHNAIEEFGFAPRDVYEGVIYPETTKDLHATAVGQLNYATLLRYVRAFTTGQVLPDLSHRIIAVEPDQVKLRNVKWKINFKSIRIAKAVAVSMREAEAEHLRETYDLLYKIPASSSMAGWVFEGFAHRVFAAGWRSDEPLPQPILMIPNKGTPPTFSLPDSPQPVPLSTPQPVRTSAREAIQINLTADLDDVTLESDRYYAPATINPLFDAFTIDHDPDNHTVVISVFQMTASPSHAGSSKGYPHIQKIMARVHELLLPKHSDTTVKVAYFLVCPEKESGKEWKMSDGWNRKVTKRYPEGYGYDHSGDVFRLPFPGFKVKRNRAQQ